MNLDPNKVIDDLSKAEESVRTAAKYIKSIKQYITQSGIKATAKLVPELDQLMSSFKQICEADVNSINHLVETIDSLPFSELRDSAEREDDIFSSGEDSDFEDDSSTEDIFDPENYIQDDVDAVSAIANKSAATPARESDDLRRAALLRKYLKKPIQEKRTQSKGLSFDQIQEELDEEGDVFAGVKDTESYTEAYQQNLTNLSESNSLEEFTKSQGFKNMQDCLDREGITNKMNEAGGDKFLRLARAGRIQEASSSLKIAGLEQKLESSSKLSWEDLGKNDIEDVNYSNCGLNL